MFSFADWMKCEKTKLPQSGRLLASHKPTEVEEKMTNEILEGVVT